MFSLQLLFGKADRFYQLLEDAASEAHESVRLVIEMIKSPRPPKVWTILHSRAARRKRSRSRSPRNW